MFKLTHVKTRQQQIFTPPLSKFDVCRPAEVFGIRMTVGAISNSIECNRQKIKFKFSVLWSIPLFRRLSTGLECTASNTVQLIHRVRDTLRGDWRSVRSVCVMCNIQRKQKSNIHLVRNSKRIVPFHVTALRTVLKIDVFET